MNYSEWYQIAQQAGLNEISSADVLSTSMLSQSWQLTTITGQRYWARTCLARHQAVIECEQENIEALQQTGISTQTQVVQGKTSKTAWLISDWQMLSQTIAEPQQALTELHRLHCLQSSHNAYGWAHANDINGLVQSNQWLSDWSSFYRSQRLLPQLRKAKENGLAQRFIENIEQLITHYFDAHFEAYQPKPSLVHGNLYQAPLKMMNNGSLFFYHPACYFGDAEVDRAAVLLAHHHDELIQGEDLDTTIKLSTEADARLIWYQLYYALVEFNLMTQHDARLIKVLIKRIETIDCLN
jgi:protein-ribulosamine 3-kinase